MKKIVFILLLFVANDVSAFIKIETKTIFESEKIGESLVTLKTEINDLKIYDVDCLSCFKKAIEISRIGFLKFCREIYPAPRYLKLKRNDNLTIILISVETMEKLKKYFFNISNPKLKILGLYDYNRKTIYIMILSDNFYYFHYLYTLLHELAHYYFDIYDLRQHSIIEHSYINLYIDFMVQNYWSDLFLNSLNE